MTFLSKFIQILFFVYILSETLPDTSRTLIAMLLMYFHDSLAFYILNYINILDMDAIYHYSVDERQYFFCNQRFVELFALENPKPKPVMAEQILKKIHPQDREKLLNAFESGLAASIDKGEMRYRLLRQNDDTRWLHDRWIVVREGGTLAVEGFIRDITEEKLAVEKFLDSKQNAPIGTFIVQDDKFKYVNTEIIRIIGYTKDELLDSNPFVYI